MVIEEAALAAKYLNVRNQTEVICRPLTAEDHVVQPVVDVSPPKWHLGHTTWFFETFILQPHKPGYKAFDKNYNYLFNSYYETVGARVVRTDRGNITRPTVDEVMQYRQHINEQMEEFLSAEISQEISTLLELGLQHEQQHQELLMYDIKYILGNNPLLPTYISQSAAPVTGRESSFETIPAGLYTIGYEGNGFSFDNEHGVHQVYLHDYEIMDRLVTNGEYLEFIEDGGYTYFGHWLADAWDWVNKEQIKSPYHWHRQDDGWYQYSLNGGLKPLQMDAPLTHVSFYEADAYAKWKGMRLPTEFEWEVASRHLNANPDQANFMNKQHYEPRPASEDNTQIFGDVWEWTSSAYRPYPYYKAPEGAVGEYNGKFMVNQMVLRGGSCATPQNHIRNTYRNFFHPHLRWMFSGLRLANHI